MDSSESKKYTKIDSVAVSGAIGGSAKQPVRSIRQLDLTDTPIKKFFPTLGWQKGKVVSAGSSLQKQDPSQISSNTTESAAETRYIVRFENDTTEEYPFYVLQELIMLAMIDVGTRVVLYSYETDRYFHATVQAIDDARTNNIRAEFETTRSDWIDIRRFKFQLLSENVLAFVRVTPRNNDASRGDNVSGKAKEKMSKKETKDRSTQTSVEEKLNQSTQTEVEQQNQFTQTAEEEKVDHGTQTTAEQKIDQGTQTPAETMRTQETQTTAEDRKNQESQTTPEDRKNQESQTTFVFPEKEQRETQTVPEETKRQDAQTPGLAQQIIKEEQAVSGEKKTQATHTQSEPEQRIRDPHAVAGDKKTQATHTQSEPEQRIRDPQAVDEMKTQATHTQSEPEQKVQNTQIVLEKVKNEATQFARETQTAKEEEKDQKSSTEVKIREPAAKESIGAVSQVVKPSNNGSAGNLAAPHAQSIHLGFKSEDEVSGKQPSLETVDQVMASFKKHQSVSGLGHRAEEGDDAPDEHGEIDDLKESDDGRQIFVFDSARRKISKGEPSGDVPPVVVLKTPPLSTVRKDTRLAVLWNQNDEYYACSVASIRKGKCRSSYLLEYLHDSYLEWTILSDREFYLLDDFLEYEGYLNSQRDGSLAAENIKKIKRQEEELNEDRQYESTRDPLVRVENPADKGFGADLQASLSRSMRHLQAGRRVAVWCTSEKTYLKGVVTKERERKGITEFHVKYDCGEKCWVDFYKQAFIVMKNISNDGEDLDTKPPAETSSDAAPDPDEVTSDPKPSSKRKSASPNVTTREARKKRRRTG